MSTVSLHRHHQHPLVEVQLYAQNRLKGYRVIAQLDCQVHQHCNQSNVNSGNVQRQQEGTQSSMKKRTRGGSSAPSKRGRPGTTSIVH